jgi:predicted oxidoreductase
MALFDTTRRRALQLLALLGLGRSGLARAANAIVEAEGAPAGDWPAMSYRTLGRTGFDGSRLVFGCGAALMFFSRDELLNAALEHGVNVFDVGTRDYYRDAEANLAAFAKQNRDRIFLISKGLVGLEIEPGMELSAEQRRSAAANWSKALDQSLVDLGTDHVDAYYVMAANNPALIRSEEMHAAFLAAEAGRQGRALGLSTHQNAQAVLEAACRQAGTRWQIAVTPAAGTTDAEGGQPKQPMAALGRRSSGRARRASG